MSNKNISKILSSSTLALSLVLTGFIGDCKKKDPATGKSAEKVADKLVDASQKSGPVLCSINGTPSIYESDFIESINQMMQQNPYFRGASIEALPGKLKRQLLDKLTDQELILAKAYKNNITETEEFKTSLKKTMQLVERALAIQAFEKNLYESLEVSNEAIENNYKENKEKYVKVAGGVLASGAKFDNDADATKFIESVKAKPLTFDKLAKETKNAKFKHFGRVNQMAPQGMEGENIPEQIKTAILKSPSFPHVEKVSLGKDNVWVVAAFDKQESIYYELDEIKKQIEAMIKNNNYAKALEDQLKELRNTMTVTINEEYFQDPTDNTMAHDNSEEDNTEQASGQDIVQTAENNSASLAA